MSTVSTLFDGKLNILINIVGRNIRKPVVDFTAAGFSTLMATNFESVFHISQLAYPPLKASGVGSIVLTSSVSGFVSLKSMSVQGATKGAQQQRIPRRGVFLHSSSASWRSKGGLISCGIPLLTCTNLHHWADCLC
ncbi:hypothetical protein ACJW30_08G052500 [Castanea mollissima]